MSDMRTALGLFLPDGQAWNPKIVSDYEKLLQGIADYFQIVFNDAESLRYIRKSDKTKWLENLMEEFGIFNNELLSAVEKQQLVDAIQFAIARYGDDWTLKDALNKGGFSNLNVFHNDPPANPSGIIGDGEWVINRTRTVNPLVYICCAGEPEACAGNENAIAGSQKLITYDRPVEIEDADLTSEILQDGDFEEATILDWFAGEGSTVIIDGDFEADGTDYWIPEPAGVLETIVSKSNINPHSGLRCLRITRSEIYPIIGSYSYAKYYVPVASTGKYNLRGWFRGDGGDGSVKVSAGLSNVISTNSYEWQQFDLWGISLTAGDEIFFEMRSAVPGSFAEIGNISLSLNISDLSISSVTPFSGAQCMEISNLTAVDPLEEKRPSAELDPGSADTNLTMLFTGVARGDTAENVAPEIRNGDKVLWTGLVSEDWQEFSISVRILDGPLSLSMTGQEGVVGFDDLSLIPYNEAWRWQRVFFVAEDATFAEDGTIEGLTVRDISPNKRDALREIILRHKPWGSFCWLEVDWVEPVTSTGFGFFPFSPGAWGL